MRENQNASQEGSQEQIEENTYIEIINGKTTIPKVTNDQGIQVKHVKTCTLTYQRGSRKFFSASKRQGTLPYTSAQPLERGKKKVKEEEEDHEKEREFELIHIDSDDENETRISSSLLQDRNAQIKDLEAE